MKSKVHLFFAITLGIVTLALLQSAVTVAAEKVNLKSLRGETPLTEEPSATALKDPPKDHAPEARNYLHQPPLIPHTIRDYNITRTHNKCMECHSWQRYREFGATKVSMTHFKDRSGTDIANVSPLRYFCTQCHVPQADTKPLVENTFRPVEAIKPAVK
ncbi:MAG TPA: nitrate reductase cytochrome c-type subunit [Acidiferrobacterales bacterium]|nr:nitrate reductase cytochrome c-type subunit [Acidiferrobacterales bacterium]